MAELRDGVLSYFIIGVVMWGSGVSEWGGATKLFFKNPNSTAVTGTAAGTLEQADSTVGGLIAESVSGPFRVVWQIATGFTEIMAWPVVTLAEANAPLSVTMLLGGTMTAGFFMAFVTFLKRSA